MSIEYYEVAPPEYVEISNAAASVNRSTRSVYDWIRNEGIRTFKQTNGPTLVHLGDVLRVEGERQKGRRRKPRLPRL